MAMWHQPASRFGLGGIAEVGREEPSSQEGRPAPLSESTGVLGLRSLRRGEGLNDPLVKQMSPARVLPEVSEVQIDNDQREGIRFAFMDKEVLETSTAVPLPSLLSGFAQHEMCKSITSGVVDAISELSLWDRQEKMLEAITNITVEPPDLSSIQASIARLDSKDRHAEMLKAVTSVRVDPSDFAPVLGAISQLGGVRERHMEIVDALSSIQAQPHPQLLLAISQLQDSVAGLQARERHTEVLEAISRIYVEPADLRPMETTMQEIRNEMRRSSEELRREFLATREEVRQDVGVLRIEASEGRKEARGDAEVLAGELRALPQVLTDMKQAIRKLDQKVDQTQSVQTEILQTVSDFGRHLKPDSELVDAVAEAVHERLTRASLKVDHSEVLLAMRRMDSNQHLLDAISRLDKRMDFSPIVHAINSAELDLQPIHDAIGQIQLVVDNTPVLEAVRSIKPLDPETIGSAVHARMFPVLEAISQLNTPVLEAISQLNSPVLEAVRSIKPLDSETIGSAVQARLRPVLEAIRQSPDSQSIAAATVFEMKKNTFSVDQSKVLQAIDAWQVDFSPILSAISGMKLDLDLVPVLDAISRLHIPDERLIADSVHDRLHLHSLQLDFNPVFEALEKISVDFTPVLQAIRRLDQAPVLDAINQIDCPDAQCIANAVNDRIRKQQLSVDHGEVLQAIRKIKIEPDLTAIISAISPSEVGLTPIYDALRKMETDGAEVLDAVRQMNSELMEQLRKTTVQTTSTDLEPLINAINASEVDLSSVVEAIGTMNATVNTMRSEVRELISKEIKVVEKECVVETVVPKVMETQMSPVEPKPLPVQVPVPLQVVSCPIQLTPQGSMSATISPRTASPRYSASPIPRLSSGSTQFGPPRNSLSGASQVQVRAAEAVTPRSVEVLQPMRTAELSAITRQQSVETFMSGRALISQPSIESIPSQGGGWLHKDMVQRSASTGRLSVSLSSTLSPAATQVALDEPLQRSQRRTRTSPAMSMTPLTTQPRFEEDMDVSASVTAPTFELLTPEGRVSFN